MASSGVLRVTAEEEDMVVDWRAEGAKERPARCGGSLQNSGEGEESGWRGVAGWEAELHS